MMHKRIWCVLVRMKIMDECCTYIQTIMMLWSVNIWIVIESSQKWNTCLYCISLMRAERSVVKMIINACTFYLRIVYWLLIFQESTLSTDYRLRVMKSRANLVSLVLELDQVKFKRLWKFTLVLSAEMGFGSLWEEFIFKDNFVKIFKSIIIIHLIRIL